MKFKCPCCGEKSFTAQDKLWSSCGGIIQCRVCNSYVRISGKLLAILVFVAVAGVAVLHGRARPSALFSGTLILLIMLGEIIVSIVSPLVFLSKGFPKSGKNRVEGQQKLR